MRLRSRIWLAIFMALTPLALTLPMPDAALAVNGQGFNQIIAAARSYNGAGFAGETSYGVYYPGATNPGGINSQTSNTPYGLNQDNVPGYAEAGAVKVCNFLNDCKLHPYASWQKLDGSGTAQTILTNITLVEGWNYGYSTYFIGNNHWLMQYEDGNGWHQIANVDLGMSQTFTLIGSGGESTCTTYNCPLGTVYTSANQQYGADGTTNWWGWCYTFVRNNTPITGQPSPCGSNFTWSVSF